MSRDGPSCQYQYSKQVLNELAYLFEKSLRRKNGDLGFKLANKQRILPVALPGNAGKLIPRELDGRIEFLLKLVNGDEPQLLVETGSILRKNPGYPDLVSRKALKKGTLSTLVMPGRNNGGADSRVSSQQGTLFVNSTGSRRLSIINQSLIKPLIMTATPVRGAMR